VQRLLATYDRSTRRPSGGRARHVIVSVNREGERSREVPALIVQSGPEAGSRLEVEGEHTIGREDQEFTLSDPEVSRRHAVVRVTATGVEIEDAGSSNGTFVNGDRIAGTTVLGDGDEVRLGQTTLSVEAPRVQATKISAPPVDPGATVVRPPSERPAPDGPPEEPAPGEPEQPGYQPPGHEEPVPSAPAPGDYQAPQPDQPAPGGGGPDLVTDPGTQGFAQPGYGAPPEQGAYPPPEQSAYPAPEQSAYPPPEQSAYTAPEQGAYAPPTQGGGWQSAPQPSYGTPGYGGGGSKTWLWILIGVVVVAAIAAVVILFVL
jgi:pSer/pThr/pTyr-binding forkhead associated (FHA) protein